MSEIQAVQQAKVTLSLNTTVTCPIDPTHRFPLHEGLSRTSIEELVATAQNAEEALRQQIESEVRRNSANQVRQEKDRLQKSYQEEKNAFDSFRDEQDKAMKEMRKTLQEQRLAEIHLKQQLDDQKATQEVAIAKALQEQRERDRTRLTAEIRTSMESEINRIRESSVPK